MRIHPVTIALAISSLMLMSISARAQCPVEHDLGGGTDDYVYTLAAYNGQVVAGGDFESIGGQTCNHIAIWNGINWVSLGGPFASVRHLTVFQGDLIASSGGNLLGRWNGSSWQMQNTPNGMTNSFAVYNDEFIIGGQFFSSNNFVNVLRWSFATGQWQAMGAPGTFGTYSVKALVVYNGELIAGGDFFVLNGKPVAGLARWNESAQQWQPFDSGLNDNASVYALTVYNGDLIVAGAFVSAGGVNSRGIARWNALDGWRSFAGGVSQYVDTVTIYNGDLIAGGYFTMAGSTPVNNIARWNENAQSWAPVGAGVTNCCGYGAAVYTVAVANDKLFAGGWFGFGQDGPQRIIAWEDCMTLCTGDVSGDRTVNVNDLLAVINGWGACPAGNVCSADVNHDGQVNVSDLLAVINAWGPCP